ncbi:MAG: ribosome biogenesis GTPase Der [Planctomycetes bacterium]|nr:ribosome biogenesis GTPase Der [Planctomycetota bacterium]
MSLPVVAIVGRPNVGKSSLLNALVRSRIAIVDPTPGVTRDRVAVELHHNDHRCELVDTGGIGVVDKLGLEEEVEAQIEIAMRGAALLLFVLDAQEGVTNPDREIAARLRKLGKPLLVVANKADHQGFEKSSAELWELGLGEPFCVSTVANRNVGELREKIFELLPSAPEVAPEGDVVRIAVVGRTNAGKSTLVNKIVGDDRMIVSEVPGTTRDAVDLRFDHGGRTCVVVDTAGLRRINSVQGSPDFYAQARSERAIRRSDVALFLIDSFEEIGKIEHQLARLLLDSGKPFVIVLTKWDLVEGKKNFEQFGAYVRDRLDFLQFAPITCIAAQEGVRIKETLDLVIGLHEAAGKRLGTGEVMRLFKDAMERRAPPIRGGKTGKIFYASQVDIRPPTIVLFVNEAKIVSAPYQRWLGNVLRDAGHFEEVPIRFLVRERIKNTPQE